MQMQFLSGLQMHMVI